MTCHFLAFGKGKSYVIFSFLKLFKLVATNRKESLDPALLRPGRFDRHILVDKPDEEARQQIWNIYVNKQQNAKVKMFEEDIDLHELAKKAEGMVGADIEEIVRRSIEKAVFESFETKKDARVSTPMLMDEIKLFQKERTKEEQEMTRQRKIGFGRPDKEGERQ